MMRSSTLYLIFAALMVVLAVTGCRYDLDNVPRPGGDTRPPDSRLDQTEIDTLARDASRAEGLKPDGPPADRGLDVVKLDGPAQDAVTTDLLVADKAMMDQASTDTTKPDQGTPAKPVLLSGGIGGLGPVSAGGYLLLEGNFTWGETVCDGTAKLCLSGGVGP